MVRPWQQNHGAVLIMCRACSRAVVVKLSDQTPLDFTMKKEADPGGWHHCDPSHEKTRPHPCPYQQELNDLEDNVCTCCAECVQICADDV
jgi:hypothetical protein